MVHKMRSLGQQHQLTPGNLFEIQILGSHTRPTKLETLREGAHQVCPHKPSDRYKSLRTTGLENIRLQLL